MNHQNTDHRIAVITPSDAEGYAFIEQLCRTAENVRENPLELQQVRDIEALTKPGPRVVVLTADAMDLEEGLVMVPRLIDMHEQVVVAVLGYDRLKATGHKLDFNRLGFLMGLQAISVEAGNEASVENFYKLLGRVSANRRDAEKGTQETGEKGFRHLHVDYGPDVESAIDELTLLVEKIPNVRDRFSRRDLCIRLLEHPEESLAKISDAPNRAEIAREVEEWRRYIREIYHQEAEDVIHLGRHGFVHGALEATLHHRRHDTGHTIAERVDKLLTNKWVGLPLLLLILYGVFECTFTIGGYPQGWIAGWVDALSVWLKDALPQGWLGSMLADGVVQGVGAVVSFLPNIMILFFFITLMEDSGYMWRAAYLTDGIMHTVGLHGKSFIPMLVGFGCNVPAIMAARNIENRRDRTLTILMIPFMSCSARLPVYMLLVDAFFPRHKGLVMMSLYLVGVGLSILFAMMMKHTPWFRKEEEDYVSELPPYRMPTFKAVANHIWERCEDYLRKVYGVILVASVVIWALYYFPRNEHLTSDYAERIAVLETVSGAEAEAEIAALDMERDRIQREHSALAMIGKWMEPVMRPLGFDWKMNVCILTGLPAKEAIVSTMGILYYDGGEEKLSDTLRERSVFTPLEAYVFMLFVLLYFPCLATVGAIGKEIGRKWAVFTVVHSLVLAWVVCFLVHWAGGIL